MSVSFLPTVQVTCPVQPAPAVCDWLSVSPAAGDSTGSHNTLNVTVNTAGLPAGTYTGAVSVSGTSAPASGSATVTLTVAPPISVTPASLSFTYQPGSAAMPPAQSLAVSSTLSGTSFTASATTSSGGNWLIIPANESGASAPALSP